MTMPRLRLSRTSPIILLIIYFSYGISAFAEEVKIYKPSIEGYRLDKCLEWGRRCGAPAAIAFCRKIGHQTATRYKLADDIGRKHPTKVLRGGRICRQSYCDGFKYITCKLKGIANTKLNELIPPRYQRPRRDRSILENPDTEDVNYGDEFARSIEFRKYVSLVDSTITLIGHRAHWQGNSLVKEIEKACPTGAVLCSLTKKQTFLNRYLNQ